MRLLGFVNLVLFRGGFGGGGLGVGTVDEEAEGDVEDDDGGQRCPHVAGDAVAQNKVEQVVLAEEKADDRRRDDQNAVREDGLEQLSLRNQLVLRKNKPTLEFIRWRFKKSHLAALHAGEITNNSGRKRRFSFTSRELLSKTDQVVEKIT